MSDNNKFKDEQLEERLKTLCIPNVNRTESDLVQQVKRVAFYTNFLDTN